MSPLTCRLSAAALCLVAVAGCHQQTAAAPSRPAAPPPGPAVVQASAQEGTPTKQTPQPPPLQQATVRVTEAPRSVSVPNLLYHPGRSESLDISGTLVGQDSVTLSGNISFIVTRESSHGRPVNIMNTTVVLRGAGGKREQFEHQTAYELRRDGRLKLLYKSDGSNQLWVNSSTCAGEPRDFTDGHADGCETHFDDDSVERTTSAVTIDGDYLKVTTITKTTDKSGDRDSTETLWLDPSTGHMVRYSGALTGSDGIQLTLTGR